MLNQNKRWYGCNFQNLFVEKHHRCRYQPHEKGQTQPNKSIYQNERSAGQKPIRNYQTHTTKYEQHEFARESLQLNLIESAISAINSIRHAAAFLFRLNIAVRNRLENVTRNEVESVHQHTCVAHNTNYSMALVKYRATNKIIINI